MNALIRPLAALSLLCPLAYGGGFSKGQTVVVVPEEVPIYVGAKVVATAQEGDSLSVIKTQGKWLGILYRGKKGWVRTDQVRVRPRPAPRPVAQAASEPVERVAPRPVERTVTFKGYFTEGGNRHQHDLRGVFNRTGRDKWDAAFHFVWGNQKHVYRGTMTGNLRSGAVEGQARSGGRTWIIAGTARDGALNCKHYETTGGNRRSTGDFIIRR